MKKVHLTKKRLKALDMAITFDDILYAKFDRLQRQLHEDARRLIHNRRKVYRVIRKGKYNKVMQILDVQMSDFGSTIYVA